MNTLYCVIQFAQCGIQSSVEYSPVWNTVYSVEYSIQCGIQSSVEYSIQCGIQSSVEYSIQCVQSAESPHYLETMAHWHTTLSSQTLSEGEIRPATRGTGSQASPGTWPGSRCGKKEKIEVAFLIFFRNCQIRSFMFCSLVQGI